MNPKDFLGLTQDIGHFNKRVTIQVAPASVNGFNETAGSWTTVATRWAAVIPSNGNEFQRGNQIAAETTHMVEMLWYSGLSNANRLTWTFKGVTLVLEIVSIGNGNGNGTYLFIQCKQLEGAT